MSTFKSFQVCDESVLGWDRHLTTFHTPIKIERSVRSIEFWDNLSRNSFPDFLHELSALTGVPIMSQQWNIFGKRKLLRSQKKTGNYDLMIFEGQSLTPISKVLKCSLGPNFDGRKPKNLFFLKTSTSQ